MYSVRVKEFLDILGEIANRNNIFKSECICESMREL